jgi:hypothetical protein
MPRKRALLAGLGLFALSGLAHADSVDYNTPGDLTTKFNLNNQSGTGGFTQVTSGGIGNSGAVDVTAGNPPDVTAVYNVRSFNPADGPIRISQYVKVLPTYALGDRLLQLGLIDDTATGHQLNGGAPAVADFISARVFPTVLPVAGSPTAAFTWQVQAGQNPTATSQNTTTFNNNQSANFNLILGDWYLLNVDITKSAIPNVFSVGGSLQDFGTDGLTAGATMTFAPENSSASATDIYADTTVFGAFRGHAATGGADMFDNFSITQNVVPEPASLGLLGLAAMAMGARRKRK